MHVLLTRMSGTTNQHTRTHAKTYTMWYTKEKTDWFTHTVSCLDLMTICPESDDDHILTLTLLIHSSPCPNSPSVFVASPLCPSSRALSSPACSSSPTLCAMSWTDALCSPPCSWQPAPHQSCLLSVLCVIMKARMRKEWRRRRRSRNMRGFLATRLEREALLVHPHLDEYVYVFRWVCILVFRWIYICV